MLCRVLVIFEIGRGYDLETQYLCSWLANIFEVTKRLEILAPRRHGGVPSGAFRRHHTLEDPAPWFFAQPYRLFLHMAKSMRSKPPVPVFCVLLFSSIACRPPLRAFCRCLLVAFAVFMAALSASFLETVTSAAGSGCA